MVNIKGVNIAHYTVVWHTIFSKLNSVVQVSSIILQVLWPCLCHSGSFATHIRLALDSKPLFVSSRKSEVVATPSTPGGIMHWRFAVLKGVRQGRTVHIYSASYLFSMLAEILMRMAIDGFKGDRCDDW